MSTIKASVIRVISMAGKNQAEVIAQIGKKQCTKHIHRDRDGIWRYCFAQIPPKEEGAKPRLMLRQIEFAG